MATNGDKEDTEMIDRDGEKVVTMMDVLQEQEDFEEDANAVLGASDDKNCTYPMGYIKRQALYACLTCCVDAKEDPSKRAAICLACSLKCHEDHELVELYTKRNFRCDCGNPKFNSHPCQFISNKSDLNEENTYNQNFSGLYCICHRPYPDPDVTEEDEMIQCIICEDWLHSDHLDATVPDSDQYAEMICKTCMQRNEFLHNYSDLIVNGNDVIDVVNISVNGFTDSIGDGNINTLEISNSQSEKAVMKSQIEAEHNEITSNENNLSLNIPENTKVKEAVNITQIVSDVETTAPVTASLLVEVQKDDQSLNEKVNEVTNNEMVLDQKPCDNESPQSESGHILDESKEREMIGDLVQNCPLETNKPDIEQNITYNEQENIAEQMSADNITAASENKGVESCENDKIISSINIPNKSVELSVETKSELTSDKCIVSNSDDATDKSTENIDTKPNNSNDVEDVPQREKINTHSFESRFDEKEKCNNEETNANKPLEEKSVIEASKDTESSQNVDNSTDITNSESTINEHVDTKSKIEQHKVINEDIEKPDIKRKLSAEELDGGTESKKLKLESKTCVKPNETKRKYKGATFWPSCFRQNLCTCGECLAMYKDLSVLFLIDLEDTVSAYEKLGKERSNGKPASEYEKGLAALSSLDRIQQINALTEYNKMRDKLLDFLKSFKDRGEVVKEEDIKAFFAGMKPKREPDGVYFCR
ncbi:unnamed protein product [Leptosia nina]|uniref:UBR-type domain-containing protein n=1 Tax=Leptosia nina TaxID=320188 RepID=A0AAV1IUD1_9NEOP